MKTVTKWLLALVLGLSPMCAYAADVAIDLEWLPPTENTDGSPLTDLASYKIYWGFSSGSYSQSVAVNDAYATNYSLPLGGLEAQTPVFVAMTALDLDGNESSFSNQIAFFLTVQDELSPAPPETLTGTIRVTSCPAGHACEATSN